MKDISIGQLNKTISALVDTKSDKQLYSQITESAKLFISADSAKLFLMNNDRLKKVYATDGIIKQNTLILNKNFTKLLRSNEILQFTEKGIKELQIKDFPHEIKSLIVVPLLNKNKQVGLLILYFLKDRTSLTLEERDILTLFTQTSVLIINKAKMQEESQKALEIRDRFISLASHELRTPLTSIHGYIQLLYSRMQKKDSLEARWVNELYIESIRMTTLVKELLDVNRIKQGQFAFVYSEVPLQEVITRAIERYRLTNATTSFEFQCKLTDHESKVVGDFDKLVEMVSGLLGNAVKFSKPGEKIIVVLRSSDGALSLEVSDKGKGLSKQDLDAILNGFYKPEQASYIEGMGVGLLLAQHIVDNHRGKLKIRSKKNKGTTVTVTLPTLKTVN